MRKIEEASPQRASRALLAHIREKYGTIPAFCEAKEQDRFKVQKAIKGEMKRVEIAFAVSIQAATDGAVPAEWWAESSDDESQSGAAE